MIFSLKILLKEVMFFMRNEFKAIALEWIRKAQSDSGFADASFREFDDFYSQMCVLCHDAAEKFLKGFIALHGTKPERTHDLLNLLSTCLKLAQNKESLVKLETCCKTLNRYYTPLKYPSHFPTMTKDQALEAIESVKSIEKVILGNMEL